MMQSLLVSPLAPRLGSLIWGSSSLSTGSKNDVYKKK